ncbi:hypothetical protein [Streptomyces inhibens]|uniref:hypothetical protein n=1 Tax=Streptomyces inhibens TaxID=2293571 RepID=UPI001EE6B8B6|nr:hypothetical protein [Streptomyces inhibens]UKY52137.1 hypothetical protein KI385_27200 [Streptomyces inhibens]
MGIESDQLVFDYLSRVGDLAQQRGLPSATRMRLVSRLRAEIDGQKADSVAGVKRVLARLGTPEAVVAAAGSADDRVPGASRAGSGAGQARAKTSASGAGPEVPIAPQPTQPSRPADPPPPRTTAFEKLSSLARRSGLTGKASANGRAKANGKVPAPRDGAADSAPAVGLPPHLAGTDELGEASDAPDWWRVEPSPFGAGETVPGFVGGIEIPEIWDRPKGERPLSLKKVGDGAEGAEGEKEQGAADGDAAEGERPLPGLLRRALARRRGAVADAPAEDEGAAEVQEEEAAAPVPLRAWLSPVLTLAVLLLVAGAVLGSWFALAGGWALAYVSRRLSRAEAKFAALGVPGVVVGGLVVWLWGRFDGRWGEPIAQGRLGPELAAGLPVMARVAAVASALFLLWRMRRAAR